MPDKKVKKEKVNTQKQGKNNKWRKKKVKKYVLDDITPGKKYILERLNKKRKIDYGIKNYEKKKKEKIK